MSSPGVSRGWKRWTVVGLMLLGTAILAATLYPILNPSNTSDGEAPSPSIPNGDIELIDQKRPVDALEKKPEETDEPTGKTAQQPPREDDGDVSRGTPGTGETDAVDETAIEVPTVQDKPAPILRRTLPFIDPVDSIDTYTVGIPVGRGRGMIDPVELNQWAIENGLLQTWEIPLSSSVSQSYEKVIESERRGQEALQANRSRAEFQSVKDAMQSFNGIDDFSRMDPGPYLGPFLFGAKAAEDPRTGFIHSESVEEPAQITLSVIDASLPDSLPTAAACPTTFSYSPVVDAEILGGPTRLRTIKPLRDPSRPALQFVQLTRPQWESLDATFPDINLVMGGYPMDVDLSARRTNLQAPYVLSESDKQALRSLLALPKQRSPVLIVFDDSWPADDPAAFQRSMRFFCDAMDVVWRDLPVGYESLPAKCTAQMRSAAVPERPKLSPVCTGPDCRTHAERIRAALDPFVSLTGADEKSPVNVVYLPFNDAQLYAWEVLRRLVLLQAVFAPSPDIRIDRYDAANTYELLSRSVHRGLPKELDLNLDIYRSNVLLYDSLLIFARLYTLMTGEPVVINTSWTLIDKNVRFADASQGLNMIFAAAGNNCDPNATVPAVKCTQSYVDRSDFRHLVHPETHSRRDNYVAVMNVDADGRPACHSTRVTNDNFAVAFSGGIPGDCGTSFSSPRAAWLYALYQSRIPKLASMTAPAAANAATLWLVEAKRAIERTAHCAAPMAEDYSCLLMKVPGLLQLVEQ